MPRVLLVDDDPTMLKLLEVNFQLEGFATQTAARGEDAVALVRSERFDAIVLDVMLPGLDGHEVYRAIREDPATEALPVVFLSGRTSEEDGRYAPGEVDSMVKPFDPADLVALVRRRTQGSA